MGFEIAVEYVFAWLVRKAGRVAGRADAEVDRGLDAGMDRLHDLISRKLGQDPVLERAAEEAGAGQAEPSQRTRRRLADSLEDAAERDQDFAQALQALVEELQTAAQASGAVWAMSDGEFEEYVAGLCRRDGCTQVRRVGRAGDLGADVIGRLPDGRKLAVQCKRYAKHCSVGSRDLQTFYGTARQEHGADIPVFVASCVITQPARTFAAKYALVLVDVNLLGFWNSGTPLTSLIDLGIGRSGIHRKLVPDS